MKKPKEPTKPRKPHKPVKPTERISHIEIRTISPWELQDNSLLKCVQNVFGLGDSDVDFSKVKITEIDNGSDYGCDIEIVYDIGERKNPNYDFESKKYRRDLISYNKQMIDYEEKIKQYEKDLKKYNENLKAYEVKKALMLLKRHGKTVEVSE